MSFYDDYVADGACCQSCGAYLGDEPGFARYCDGCKPKEEQPKRKRGGGNSRRGRAARRKTET